MIFPEGSPAVSFVVEGTEYQLFAPYTPEMFNLPEGLGTPEIMARKANQTLKEDISNNWRSRVKKVLDEDNSVPPSQEEFEAYLAEYEPGLRKSAVTVDPVEAKALVLAKADLRKILKTKKNLKVAKKGEEPGEGEVAFDLFEAKAQQLVEQHPAYLEKAREILDAASTSVLNAADLDL